MTVAKVAEVSAGSRQDYEHAINKALARANETIDDIEGAWVKDMKIDVRNGQVENYRVTLKLAFVLR